MLASPNVANLQGSLNALNDNVVETIINIARKLNFTNSKRASIGFREPWFNSDCQKLKKFYRAQLRKSGNRKANPQTLHKFNELRNYYYRFLEWTENVYESRTIQSLCSAGDSKSFWSILNKLSRFKPQLDTHIKLEEWTAFFAGAPPHSAENFQPFPPGERMEDLDADISLYELCTAVKKLKSCKAAGPNGVTNECLIILSGNWILFILNFFNRIMQSEEVPATILKMLHKKGSLIDPNNYRPIVLLNTITKLFTLILNSRVHK